MEEKIDPDRLIILEPPYEDAYERICSILDLPIPASKWPHVSDKDHMKKVVQFVIVIFYALPPLMALAAVGLVIMFMVTPVWAAGLIAGLSLTLIGLQQVLKHVIKTIGSRDKNADRAV